MLLILCGVMFTILALTMKKSRRVFFAICLFMTLMFSFNYYNADSSNYLSEFILAGRMNWNDSETLWTLFLHVCRRLGLPFTAVRMIIFVVSVALIDHTVKKITKHRNVIILLYFIFPFFIDSTQIRNMLAMAILVFALPYLVSKKKKDLIVYIVSIGAATLIHNIFWIYYVLIALKYIDFKKFAIALASVFVLALILFSDIPHIVLKLFNGYHNNMSDVSKYVVKETVSFVMILALLAFYSLCVIGCLWSRKQFMRAVMAGNCSEEKFELTDMLIKCICATSAAFVLNIYSMDFVRIIRNMAVVEYAVVWEAATLCAPSKSKKAKRYLLCAAVYAAWLLIYHPYAKTVVIPMFRYNYFLDLFGL